MRSWLFVLVAGLLSALAVPATADPIDADKLFTLSLQEIRQNRLDSALASINKLVDEYPNFRLAQLVKGDLLLARTKPISTLGNASGAKVEQEELREEAKARAKSLTEPIQQGYLPQELLEVSDSIQYVFAVDASRSRLYIFQNTANGLQHVADYYVTVGKLGTGKVTEGDKRTPVGLYTITAYKPDSELEEIYGIGAYTLSYPNEWDVRNGRNGHGIWLHGVPRNTYARPPKASDGCVVLSNEDFSTLKQYILLGQTPVIIAPKLTWVAPEMLAKERDDLQQVLDNWRQDWESRDSDRLLSNYSNKFRSGNQDYNAFSESKRRINAAKSWIKIGLTNLSIYRQPGSENIAIVTFDQDYKSSNLNDISRKRQYWILEGNHWRIIQETIL